MTVISATAGAKKLHGVAHSCSMPPAVAENGPASFGRNESVPPTGNAVALAVHHMCPEGSGWEERRWSSFGAATLG